jgi:tRNA threonylcarbamoyladenosine biosynthesis protein TsaB
MYIFFDSSEYLSLGILNEEYNWVEYKKLTTKKNSEIFYGCLYDMLERNKLKLHEIKAVFQVAGPGSYTGMRLSEGLCQLLEWQGIRVYSFYHFQVPALLGEIEGGWVSEAFKGEIFLYTWDAKKENFELLPKDGRTNEEMLSKISQKIKSLHTHYDMGTFDCGFTSDQIKDSPRELFSKVHEKEMREKPYYYRPLDQEFKPSIK